jgi:hypothetical protein
MRFSSLMMAAALLGPALPAQTQEGRENPVFKVDFTIRDSGDAGGKTGRKYSLMVNRGVKTTFKVGNRVPVATGASGGGTVGNIVNTQFTYIDVGMNIDCVVAESASKFGMHADLDISTAVMPEKGAPALAQPTISQIRLNLDTTLAPGKPTVVASFDDPVTSRKFDVEATITRI